MIPRPPISTLFPYTTLFRSQVVDARQEVVAPVDVARCQRPELLVVGAVDDVDQVLEREAQADRLAPPVRVRSEEHTSELQSLRHLVCRLLLEKKKKNNKKTI